MTAGEIHKRWEESVYLIDTFYFRRRSTCGGLTEMLKTIRRISEKNVWNCSLTGQHNAYHKTAE